VKITKKLFLGVAFSLVLVISTIVIVLIVVEPKGVVIEHEPILIWSDNDFKNYDIKGKGTEESPFVINNLNITTTSSKGIYITNTTKHFIISNCLISASYMGIHIQKTAPNTAQIIQNICNDGGVGIIIHDSPGVYVSDNICNKNDKENGISIIDSPSSLIINNTCNENSGPNFHEKNYGNGISLINSPSSTLTDNICNLNNGHGISLSFSQDSIARNNHFSDNVISGIWVDYSRNSTVTNNIFKDNCLAFESLFTYNSENRHRLKEFTLDYYLSMKIIDNFVNEKPLGYYSNLTDQIITTTDDGQMIFVNCFNLTISGLSPLEFLGLSLYYCESSKIIENNFSNTAKSGLLQFYSDNALVANNTLSFNGETGIIHYNCNNSIIYNNTCLSNYWGGILVLNSSNCTISQNTCSDSGLNEGIVTVESSYITITENTCNNNRESGLASWNSMYLTIVNNTFVNNRYGIHCGPALFFNISFNLIELNRQEGIVLIASSDVGPSLNNSIHHNSITNNTLHGVSILSGSYNIVHHNSFMFNNLLGSSQGLDSGTSNYWYEQLSSSGNFWNDWLVGNYTIDGSAGAEDIYPLSSSPV